MNRDLSPPQWVAPGTAQVSIAALLSALSSDPIDIDTFVSNWSPTNGWASYNLASGFQAVPVPDTTNQRGVIIVSPRGNVISWTLKGITGDTGLLQNPNGLACLTFAAGSVPATIGITCGAAINGFTMLWW